MVKANGTHAKEIAIHFLDMTQERYTPAMVRKSIGQAKHLLNAGYTLEEIKSVVEYIVNNTNVQMYSLGYVSSAINDILMKIEEEEKEELIKQMIEDSKKEHSATLDMESDDNSESKERNKAKFDRFGVQSRVGEKSYLDMLKE